MLTCGKSLDFEPRFHYSPNWGESYDFRWNEIANLHTKISGYRADYRLAFHGNRLQFWRTESGWLIGLLLISGTPTVENNRLKDLK